MGKSYKRDDFEDEIDFEETKHKSEFDRKERKTKRDNAPIELDKSKDWNTREYLRNQR